MDPIWLNRELIDNTIEGIHLTTLNYAPDTGLYYLGETPYTGVIITRGPDGTLDSLSHLKDGVECGISVAWYPSGKLESYSEMQDDVYHGLHIEWDEDGTKRVEQHYTRGVQDG